MTLAASSRVIYLHRFYQDQPANNTVKWIAQTNILENYPLYDFGFKGSGQTIAVDERSWAYLDTGNNAHCQFKRPEHVQIMINNGTMNCNTSFCWHATSVLSTAGGDQGSFDGGTYLEPDMNDGIAPAANLILQVNYDTYYAAMQAAYNEGARIQNNSWESGPEGAYNALAQTYDQFMWDYPDFLVVFAAGNMLSQYNDYRRVLSPATAKNIITVGGTQPFPDHENRLFFSAGDGSRPGLTNDARIKPTVMLPGIVRNARQRPYSTCETANRYGTSFASPAVAGIVALVREFLSNEYGMLLPSAALTKAIIINSARNMTGLDTLGPIPSPGQGWGRVTLHDTLRMPGNAGLQLIDHSSGLPTDQSLTYQFEVTNPALWDYLKITLVWTDYPGNPAAALAIVNDLDLTVIAPDGTVYLGNVFHQGYSVVGGIPDRRNVEEQVFLPKHIIPIQEGVYRVIVHAYNVPEGPQPFALVINLHPGAGAFLPLMFNSYNLSGNMIFPPTPESGYPGPGQPESPYP